MFMNIYFSSQDFLYDTMDTIDTGLDKLKKRNFILCKFGTFFNYVI